MAIETIIDEEELIIYEIFRDPVLFNEFINNYDLLDGDEPFEFSWYQREWLYDFNHYVSIRSGRATGKTVSLVSLLTWLLVFNIFPDDYINYHVPNKIHLDPVWTGLIRQFRTNTVLKQFIAKNSGINSSDFTIKLLNQASLLCRIAGQTGTGQAVIGLHSPFVIVDESGYYPWGTFIEMQPTLNTFTQGYRMIIAGVPDGRREKSVCYHASEENSNYSKHHTTALQNPRFTEEDHQKAIEQYGGDDSDDYIHLVLGQHGRPVFALFDRGNFIINSDPVYKLSIDGLNLGQALGEYYQRISILPPLPNKNHKAIFGVDLGYTEPTAIYVLYLTEMGRIHFHAKIQFNKVSYPVQEKLLDLLDDKYDPVLIGIDKGSGGQGIHVVQTLTEHVNYAHKKYAKKLIPIDFASNIIIGVGADGEEIKNKAKPLSVSVLQEYTNNHKIVYSSTDLETITELERMTYTKNPSGEIVYRTLTPRGGKKGEDHFTSALLCASLAYYLQTDFLTFKPEKVKLAGAFWL